MSSKCGVVNKPVTVGLFITGLLSLISLFLLFGDLISGAFTFLVSVMLLMNGGFYYVQSRRRGDFIPIYPDSGIAIFFSFLSLNAVLLFVRFHRFYGSNPFTLGLYYPVPLPRSLILEGLMIAAVANLLFIITFYAEVGPRIYRQLPNPPSDAIIRQDNVSQTIFVLLILGIILYFISFLTAGISVQDILNPTVVITEISGPISGSLYVLSYNYLFTILPLFFINGVSKHGIFSKTTVVSVSVSLLLLFSGHLSFIIIALLGLFVCYHLFINRMPLPNFLMLFLSFVFIGIGGKIYRIYVRSTESPPLELIVLVGEAIFLDLPVLFLRFVVGRMSGFESFLTIKYLVDSGQTPLRLGGIYPGFIGQMVPFVGDSYFASGYYTRVIYANNVPQRFLPGDSFTAAISAFGDWYLNFHLIGIIVGTIVMAVIIRVWNEILLENKDNIWIVSFHATNIWFIYSFWTINSRLTRSLILRFFFLIGIIFIVTKVRSDLNVKIKI